MLGIVIGILCFMTGALSDIFMKYLSGDYSALQIICISSVVSSVFIFIALFVKKDINQLKSYRPHLFFVRGVYLLICLFLAIVALRYVPIADYLAITYTTPFFVIALSWILLNEKASKSLMIATLVGFIGILFIVSPGSEAFGWGGLIAIISVFFGALIVIHTRVMAWTESSFAISFWMSIICAGISLFFMPFLWIQPTWTDLIFFALIGISNSLYQILLAEALKHASASVIMPFDYTSFIWGVLFGYLIWGDVPTEIMLLGTCLIILSGLYISLKEYLDENPGKKVIWKNKFKRRLKLKNKA